MSVCATICGKEYPLVLTVKAFGELSDCIDGDLNALPAFLAGQSEDGSRNMASTMKNTIRILDILMRGGELHRRMEARFNDCDPSPMHTPTPDELGNMLLPEGISRIQLLIMRAISESMSQNVEADTSKNGECGELQ